MHEEENRIYWWRQRPNWQCNQGGSLQVQILAQAMVTNFVRGLLEKKCCCGSILEMIVKPQEKCIEIEKYVPLLFDK